MTKIGFLIHKGGVGKTTLAVHLLWWMKEKKIKALGIDFDNQSGLIRLFSGYEWEQGDEPIYRRGSVEVILGAKDNIIYDKSKYDFLIVDGRPEIDVSITLMKQIDFDVIYCPIKGRFSIEGTADIKKVRDAVSPKTKIIAIGNMIDKGWYLKKEFYKALEEMNVPVFKDQIPYTTKIAISEGDGIPIWKVGRYRGTQTRAVEVIKAFCRFNVEKKWEKVEC